MEQELGHVGSFKEIWFTVTSRAPVHVPGPVLSQQSDTVARIPANGSAAFNESCAPIG